MTETPLPPRFPPVGWLPRGPITYPTGAVFYNDYLRNHPMSRYPRSLGIALVDDEGNMLGSSKGKHDGYVLIDSLRDLPPDARAEFQGPSFEPNPRERQRAKAARKARKKARRR